MINLEFEQSAALDAQDRYDIISMAMDVADENGFVNSYLFERALYCFAVVILYPERKEELVPVLSSNLLEGWKLLVEDGTINQMKEEYIDTIKVLTSEAELWFREYSDYAHSARGVLEMIQQFSGNIVQNAANRLATTAQDTGVQEVLDIADNWGMNRVGSIPKEGKEVTQIKDSLFQK